MIFFFFGKRSKKTFVSLRRPQNIKSFLVLFSKKERTLYQRSSVIQNGSVTTASICSMVVMAAISGASPPMARAIT